MFVSLFLLFFVQVCNPLPFQVAFNYCSLKCPNTTETHIACRWPDCHPQTRTCEQIRTDMVKFRKMMLQQHNKLRNKVAMGQELEGRFPPAAQMNILKWDSELEQLAQCEANRCRGHKHNTCLTSRRFLQTGQNIFFLDRAPILQDLTKVVKFWYGFKTHMNGTDIRNYKVGAHAPFAQIVWDNTSYVGCGRSFNVRPHNPKEAFMLVCNYGYAGLHHGGYVYTPGAPCSQCHHKKCDSTYRGLCAQNRYFVKNTKTKYSSELDDEKVAWAANNAVNMKTANKILKKAARNDTFLTYVGDQIYDDLNISKWDFRKRDKYAEDRITSATSNVNGGFLAFLGLLVFFVI